MTSWIISVCGIALLSVLVDVILPNGKTHKYVQTVVGVVLTFSLLLPIANFSKDKSSQNLSFAGNFEENILLQQTYIDGIEEQNDLARIKQVEYAIANIGIKNANITTDVNGYILVKVQCNKQTLDVLQSVLPVVESKIMILWSECNG